MSRAHVVLLTRLVTLSYCSTVTARTFTLITFDVDGTLVKGSGQASDASAHARAFAHAVGAILGNGSPTPLPAEVIPRESYHGSTDGWISLRLAQVVLGVQPDEAAPQLPAIFESMYHYCAELSDDEMTRGIELLPGVLETLRTLAARDDVICGLVTGNVEGIARKKMRAVGIMATGALARAAEEQTWAGEDDCAFLGGFGSDFCSADLSDPARNHLDRGEQIAIAVRRCLTLLPEGATLARVVHVGDAPSDILAAKYCADAARVPPGTIVGCVGVATGSYTAETLAKLCGEPRPGVWEPVVLERGLADPCFVQACGV